VTVNTGAILSGTGTVSNININNGGTLAPGLRFAPGTLTAIGSLVMQAAATYLVQVSPTAQSVAAFTGTASLNGTLALNAAPGSYTFGTRYAVLTAAGGVNGTFANTTAGSGPVTATVSYDANDVYLTFSQAFITAPAARRATPKASRTRSTLTSPTHRCRPRSRTCSTCPRRNWQKLWPSSPVRTMPAAASRPHSR
jgi:uncharacterized protein with beta-barrel porin domain